MTNNLDKYYFYNGEVVKNSSISYRNIPNDAIYEVLKVVKGKPLFFEDHMDRFNKSLKKQGYIFDMPLGEILNELAFLYQVNKVVNKNIKLIYIPLVDEESFDFMIYFTERIVLSSNEKNHGVMVKTLPLERHDPNIKTIGESYKEKIDNSDNAFELLLVNQQGIITEGSRSNVFFVKDGNIYTSSPENILLGITRKKIIELCNENSITLINKSITVEEAYNMDSAFLTGTSIGVVPISHIDGNKYKDNNDIIKYLSSKYDELSDSYIDNFVMPE